MALQGNLFQSQMGMDVPTYVRITDVRYARCVRGTPQNKSDTMGQLVSMKFHTSKVYWKAHITIDFHAASGEDVKRTPYKQDKVTIEVEDTSNDAGDVVGLGYKLLKSQSTFKDMVDV